MELRAKRARVRWARRGGARRRRRRARLDEQLAVLRVFRARVRRRTAEATIQVIDAFGQTWDRLDGPRRSGTGALLRLRERAERLLTRTGNR